MKNEAKPLISMEDFCQLSTEDKKLFLSVTTNKERKKIMAGKTETIKLNKHVTVEQIRCLQKKGVEIEVHGFNFFAVTDNSLLVNVINEVNKK